MNILFKILMGIGTLIALLLIIALFVDKDYSIERDLTINKPKTEVFNYVRFLKNQDNYSKWVMTDPAMKKEYRGTDGREGFVYAWDSNHSSAGKGEQEIKKIDEGKRVDIELRFEKPFEGIASTQLITEEVTPEKTKVKWDMKGRSKYPMNIMNLFMDAMLGGDMETSLTNLKLILEK